MCLALIAIDQHPRYPLIILSNRDEFYQRSTSPAHYWEDEPNIFAGRDLVSGGTWLGVNQQGYFSLVTNYRTPTAYDPQKRSRGLLAKDYLSWGANMLPNYLDRLTISAQDYNLFNLLVGSSQNEIIYYSNMEGKIKKLTRGLYGLSNHLLDTPWYKVTRAKKLFHQINTELTQTDDPQQISKLLFPILEDTTLSPDFLLPHTGVPKAIEKALSSIFVKIPEQDYGTRDSSLVLFDKNTIFFAEKIVGETPTFKTLFY